MEREGKESDAVSGGSICSIQADDDQQKKNTEGCDLLVLVPVAIAKFNEKGRDTTKLKKNEIFALLLSCYCVHTVAVLEKERKPFFIAKLQQEIDSDGGWWYIGCECIGCECIGCSNGGGCSYSGCGYVCGKIG
jgi:hypothetical protein